MAELNDPGTATRPIMPSEQEQIEGYDNFHMYEKYVKSCPRQLLL